MYFTYTFFLLTALLISSPYYLFRFRRYAPTLGERLGRIDIPQLKGSIWVHAVSVGEVTAVGTLLGRLRAAYPDRPLVLSTITPAGRKLAQERKGLIDHCFYFPFDLPWTVRRTLARVDPEIVIIAETEIWPNFVHACRQRGIQLLMVNGRIGDRSFSRYRLVRRWLKRVLDNYSVLGMQSETDRERIESIGADSAKVTVFGNLKYDALNAVPAAATDLAAELETRPLLWVAASTTPGEEEYVLDAFVELRRRRPALTLLIAPRHPERFDSIEALIQQRGLACTRRTRLGELRQHGDILLLDTIGELASTFKYAAAVFMGGTLVPRGGHNILEPARFSKPIVFGPHMENFREISALFLNARAAIQIQGPVELAGAVDRMLGDRRLAMEMGGNARRVVEQNTGATDRVMAFLELAEARQ